MNCKENLGPGAYDVKNNTFNLENKREKYQFFGSTEVRFKDPQSCEEKGYTLIEIIKDNKKSSSNQRKSPIRKTSELKEQREPEAILPGPGEYNPNDSIFKKSRGKAFFPNSERFKGMYSKA